ncbi:MAG: hypothetical protein H0U79_06145, partial [Solirubrobacterales bacterium]|nr:hypothetical protein [Solirubrobacterales bacterium]
MAFAHEAADLLTADAAEADVPYEVVEGGRGHRRSTPLYCYRPLTDRFIAQRAGPLERLPTHAVARRELAARDGVIDYLRAQGEPAGGDAGTRAEAALRVFVSRMFADATDFAPTAERFGRAWAELDRALAAEQA